MRWRCAVTVSSECNAEGSEDRFVSLGGSCLIRQMFGIRIYSAHLLSKQDVSLTKFAVSRSFSLTPSTPVIPIFVTYFRQH